METKQVKIELYDAITSITSIKSSDISNIRRELDTICITLNNNKIINLVVV